MVKENKHAKTEQLTQDSGRMAKCMVKVFLYIVIKMSMKEMLLKAKPMGLENILTIVAKVTKVIGKIIKKKVKV